MNSENDTPEKEPVRFDLKEKYPELTTGDWRRALEFALITQKELHLGDEQVAAVLVALLQRL